MKVGLVEVRKCGCIGGRLKGLSDEVKKIVECIYKFYKLDEMFVCEIMDVVGVKLISIFYKYFKYWK